MEDKTVDLKKEVIKELDNIIKNPQVIIKEISEGNFSTLQSFYQKLAQVYVYPGMEEFTHKLPPVEMKNALEVPAIIGDPLRACGEYNTQDNKVYMYINRFQNVSSKTFVKEFISSIGILFHEFQHSKQQLYADLLKNGETDKANKFKEQLASYSQDIADDIGFNGAECIDVIKKVRPDLYKSMEAKTKKPSVPGADPVIESFYYSRPIERDARDTSLKTFDKLIKDVAKSGKLTLSALLINSRVNASLSNSKDMRRQPKHTSKEEILSCVHQLTPGDLASFAQSIEGIYETISDSDKSNLTASSIMKGNSTNASSYELERFVSVIHEMVKDSSPDTSLDIKKEKLINLKNKCPKGSFGEKIASEYLDIIKKKEAETSVRPVTREDYEREGIKPEETKIPVSPTQKTSPAKGNNPKDKSDEPMGKNM